MSGTGNSLGGWGDTASNAREADALDGALGNRPDRPAELGELHRLLVRYTTDAEPELLRLLDLVAGHPALAAGMLAEVKRRKPQDRVKIPDQIAAALLAKIKTGELTGRLPPCAEMAGHFGASHQTVSYGVAQLRAAGYVEVIRGKGTFVRPREDWPPGAPT